MKIGLMYLSYYGNEPQAGSVLKSLAGHIRSPCPIPDPFCHHKLWVSFCSCLLINIWSPLAQVFYCTDTAPGSTDFISQALVALHVHALVLRQRGAQNLRSFCASVEEALLMADSKWKQRELHNTFQISLWLDNFSKQLCVGRFAPKGWGALTAVPWSKGRSFCILTHARDQFNNANAGLYLQWWFSFLHFFSDDKS